MEKRNKESEWKIVRRLKKREGGVRLKSFTLDEETCLILNKQPNASEYIRQLVKRDKESERITPDTAEDEIFTEVECWLRIRQGKRSKWGLLEPLERFPAWSELTREEVEDMQKYAEKELERRLEYCSEESIDQQRR